MPAAYSLDLRERVVDAVEAGTSRRRAAGVFKVSVSTVIRWAKRVSAVQLERDHERLRRKGKTQDKIIDK